MILFQEYHSLVALQPRVKEKQYLNVMNKRLNLQNMPIMVFVSLCSKSSEIGFVL